MDEKRLDLVYGQVVILLLRNILSILDFEEKRFDEDRELGLFIILQLWIITILGVNLSFIMSNKFKIIAI